MIDPLHWNVDENVSIEKKMLSIKKVYACLEDSYFLNFLLIIRLMVNISRFTLQRK